MAEKKELAEKKQRKEARKEVRKEERQKLRQTESQKNKKDLVVLIISKIKFSKELNFFCLLHSHSKLTLILKAKLTFNFHFEHKIYIKLVLKIDYVIGFPISIKSTDSSHCNDFDSTSFTE